MKVNFFVSFRFAKIVKILVMSRGWATDCPIFAKYSNKKGH